MMGEKVVNGAVAEPVMPSKDAIIGWLVNELAKATGGEGTYAAWAPIPAVMAAEGNASVRIAEVHRDFVDAHGCTHIVVIEHQP